jgi:predicted enzyme related to lactoylglutathione lyase
MSQVQVEQKTYQMPPQDGFSVSHFLAVADVERSLRFYETVFEGRAVPISMRLVFAPTAAIRGKGEASWRAK